MKGGGLFIASSVHPVSMLITGGVGVYVGKKIRILPIYGGGGMYVGEARTQKALCVRVCTDLLGKWSGELILYYTQYLLSVMV